LKLHRSPEPQKNQVQVYDHVITIAESEYLCFRWDFTAALLTVDHDDNDEHAPFTQCLVLAMLRLRGLTHSKTNNPNSLLPLAKQALLAAEEVSAFNGYIFRSSSDFRGAFGSGSAFGQTAQQPQANPMFGGLAGTPNTNTNTSTGFGTCFFLLIALRHLNPL
jgi:hypothetical protein